MIGAPIKPSESGPAWKPPRANPILLGQEATERALIAACGAGRMPHAWLISGPPGIGKATLAFRLARFLFAGDRPDASTLHVDPDLPVFHRVAAGGHADLLTIERQLNEDTGRLRKEIAVEDIRRIAPFLRLTAAEGGWRIVIVDGADDMNRSGQNALLKILEEPPKGTLLMLVTDRPSALLPTIRSRCRALRLPSLRPEIVDRLIATHLPDLGPVERARLAGLAQGSIGRALDIAQHDGAALLGEFLAIAAADPVDWPAAHALGDRLAAATADESYRSFTQLLADWLSRTARGFCLAEPGWAELVAGEQAIMARLAPGGRLERALEVWEKVTHLFARSETANLDKRLTVISALDTVSTALR